MGRESILHLRHEIGVTAHCRQIAKVKYSVAKVRGGGKESILHLRLEIGVTAYCRQTAKVNTP
jgi:hypothetical protein